MGEIFFIRHGQASFGRGDYDVLSDTGREQALVLARYLADSGIRFDAAYSGTLKRQVDTAELVMGFLKGEGRPAAPQLSLNAGFNEYHADEIMRHYVPVAAAEDESVGPLLESIYTDKKSFQAVFERVMARWISGESAADGVEGWDRFRQRVGDAIESVTRDNERGGRIAVFTSGGATSAAVHIATGMSPFESLRVGWGLVNTAVTKFRYGSKGLILHSFNGYPHLELHRSGELITYR